MQARANLVGFDLTPKSHTFDRDAVIQTYQQLITKLPALSRQLLLYLLDLLAIFASKSHINGMTPASIAHVFQPVILSPVKLGEDFIEDEAHRLLRQDILISLIGCQDHSLMESRVFAIEEQNLPNEGSDKIIPQKTI